MSVMTLSTTGDLEIRTGLDITENVLALATLLRAAKI